MGKKGVRDLRNSYIRLFIYIFVITIAGVALLRLGHMPSIGKAYFFIGDKTSGSINLPDTALVGEYFTVELDLAINSSKGALLMVEVDPDLEIRIPTNPSGFVEDNVIVWTLIPEDQIVRFDVKGDDVGVYNISAAWSAGDENATVWEMLTLTEICVGGEIKDYTCPDGTNVTWCVCSAGRFACITSPEINCPQIECPTLNPPYCPDGTLIPRGNDINGCSLGVTCCGNGVCEQGEADDTDCPVCTTEPCPLMPCSFKPGTCPKDCEEINILDLADTNDNGIIETNELLNAINRWIAGEIDTTIILEGINLWINPPVDPCAGVICNDNDPCTTDSCVNGNCIYEPVDCGPGMNCMPDPGAPDQPYCIP